MSDLFDEIKQDLQEEKLAKLWGNYGNFIIGCILAVILGTCASVAFRSYQNAKYEKIGSKIYDAYVKENKADRESALSVYTSISDDTNSGIASIAQMRKASLLAKDGKADKATEIYKDISANGKTPEEIKELAEILYLQHAVDSSNDPSLIGKLEGVVKSNGPFKYSAKEILAFAKYKNSEYQESKRLFTELSDDSLTPARMRERSAEMINAINEKIDNKNG